jgi:hypothetical protein
MAYLQKTDYTLIISLDNLDEILTQAEFSSGLTTPKILENAQLWAQAKVTQILAPKYQIATELAKDFTDTTRLYLVINWVIELAVWKLHMTVNPRDIPETRQIAYDMAISEMQMSLKGESPIYGLSTVSTSVASAFVSSGVKFVSNEFKDAGQYDNLPNGLIPGSNIFIY